MKTQTTWNIVIIIIVCLLGTLAIINSHPTKQLPFVDLPEDWETIPTSKDKSDLFVGYLSEGKDTLYLRFDN